jgi:acetyl esterase/lipase
MKLTMRVITTLAALSGQPIRFSSVAAPDDDPDSIVIEPDPRAQIRPGRTSSSHQRIAYAEHSPKLRMDILVPQGTGPHPLVLYLPGGGFVSARRAMAAKQRRYVADAGFVVASIDYRTTSVGATYRDGLMDIATALRFLRAHASEYGIDPSRAAIWGESAGGYLAAMAATEPDRLPRSCCCTATTTASSRQPRRPACTRHCERPGWTAPAMSSRAAATATCPTTRRCGPAANL